MKKGICFFMALMLIFSFGAPSVQAACYPQRLHYNIWQRCYVRSDDRTQGCICIDEDDDGICDNCAERQCFTDEDKDGLCDTREACGQQERKNEGHGIAASRHSKGSGAGFGIRRRACINR